MVNGPSLWYKGGRAVKSKQLWTPFLLAPAALFAAASAERLMTPLIFVLSNRTKHALVAGGLTGDW
jgi:hypothetical protein